MLALELFSACHLLSSSLWQYRVRHCHQCSWDLYCSYIQACRTRLALISASLIKLLSDRTVAVIPEQKHSTHKEAFCTHIFSCHILMSPASPQDTDTNQGQDSLTTFPVLPSSSWLCGFHSWLPLSAALSAHITWETNTKQVMLEASSYFLAFP